METKRYDRAERLEASRSDEGRYRLLVEAITDYAVYMLDRQGFVSSWNPGAKRFKGYEPEEILGKHFSVFYTGEDQAAGIPAKALEEAAQNGKFENEGWRVRKDGTKFWAYVVIDPIRDDQERLIGFAKITRDLTERRQNELLLEQVREALFQSQKMEAVGRLTGGVAHDFNNLLMVILGSLELLRKRMPQEERLLKLLDNAVEGAQRGASLTQRMLAFSRKQQLNVEAVDIHELVNGMAELLQRTLGPSAHIETRFPLTLTPVRSDKNQLENALLNLMLNSKDAMPDGGTITIGAREALVPAGEGLTPGHYVCLWVEDTGTGMDEETLTRAIEPFFTTKGTGKGTGLGLAMVHGMVTQLGGKLEMRSKEGEGTRVEIWLPAMSEADLQRDKEKAITVVDASLDRPLKIMVVDDDPLVLLNSAAMLEDLGHTVYTAALGHLALEALQRGIQVDLIITDYAMPHMTGMQLAQILADDFPRIRVLLATGYAELSPDQDEEFKMPILHKPFPQAKLASAIATVMSKKAKVI